MVGYHNTLPFSYGLEKVGDRYRMILDVPSRCMDYYVNGEVDIALVPIGSLVARSDYQIITDYCIGCDGEVETVCVYADRPIHQLTKIYLDADSRTSQLLTKILVRDHWRHDVEYQEVEIKNLDFDKLLSDEGVLMIGDKAFGQESSYRYVFDLGLEWKRMTGLPFAFAVWIARPTLSADIISELNAALGLGVHRIDLVLQHNQKLANEIDLRAYFERYIDFHLDDQKRQAIDLYMSSVPAIVQSL